MAKETYEALQARMTKAFNMVQPRSHWKDPICAVVGSSEMAKQGVTRADIEEAIGHFTATVAKVTTYPGAYKFEAAGYRMGPAGP